MNWYLNRILSSLFCLVIVYSAQSQCTIPIVNSIDSITTSSAKIQWFNFNPNAQISIQIIQNNDPFNPNLGMIIQNQNEFLTENLLSGTNYQVYIKAVCDDGESDWNGPYDFYTAIDNENSCQLDLSIQDDNCPSFQSFSIYNDRNGVLGSNIYLTGISFIIEHSWPADLSISLQNPAGEFINLIQNTGIGTENFGVIQDDNCENSFHLDINACLDVESTGAQLTGTFTSNEDLQLLNNQSEALGYWNLLICDRAKSDIGRLKFTQLHFIENNCAIIPEVQITSVGANFVTFNWNNLALGCEDIEISYYVEGTNPNLATVLYFPCNQETGNIQSLSPTTPYNISISSLCNGNRIEDPCLLAFQTSCANPTLISSFDEELNCANSCQTDCQLLSNIWENTNADFSEWRTRNTPTPTPFTGPNHDISGDGFYLYLESSTDICSDTLKAELWSKCLQINKSSTDCDLEFYYHMFGSNIGKLDLSISTNNGNEWLSIWSTTGSQTDEWLNANVSLAQWQNKKAIIRFTGESSEGIFGDIAIDQITFRGATLADITPIYYLDNDGDGYGIDSIFLQLCDSEIPAGYSLQNGDCNDNDPSVFPNQNELVCNGIDNNCNGNEDENPDVQIQYEVLRQLNTSCSGASDGIIEIRLDNFIPPVQYNWNKSNLNSPLLLGLEAGVYSCTITDASGCFIETEDFVINESNKLLYAVAEIQSTNCTGNNTGLIDIIIDGGNPPYQILWSDGQVGPTIGNLEAGSYRATISDQGDCLRETDFIQVPANQVLVTGIISKFEVTCSGKQDGSIQIDALGGQEPYRFEWENGSLGTLRQNLTAGYYGYTVTDNNGCRTMMDSIQIFEPVSLDISIDELESNSCYGDQDGRILTSPIGGTPPYAFSWSSGDFIDDIVHLESGAYQLTIIDFNGCIAISDSLYVDGPEEMKINVESIKEPTCLFTTDGEILVSIEGGNPPYDYSWSNDNASENVNTNLSDGNYSLTVVDAFGCKSTLSNINLVSQNTGIDITNSVDNALACFGDTDAIISMTIASDAYPLELVWNTGDTASVNTNNIAFNELTAGQYQLSVTDNNGCFGESEIININSPQELSYQLVEKKNNTCFEDSNGSIIIDIKGGTEPYDVQWSNEQNGLFLNNLPSGTYLATVTDVNLCTFEISGINITSPAAINISHMTTPSTSEGDGTITVNIIGGSPPYSLVWTPPLTTTNFPIYSQIASGVYQLEVMDDNECVEVSEVVVDLINSTEQNDLGSKVKIYPNPCEDILWIDQNIDYNSAQVAIVNLQGEVVTELSLTTQKSFIEIPDIPNGLYIIVVQLNETRYTEKIMIEQ